MGNNAVLLLVMVLISAYAIAHDKPAINKTIFVKGSGGYNIYRIPALLTTLKGTLRAFCEGREGGDSSSFCYLE